MKQINLHHLGFSLRQATQEQAAYRRRRQAEHLPALHGHRTPHPPQSSIHQGRRTQIRTATHITNRPYTF